jgi:hypothetical protein
MEYCSEEEENNNVDYFEEVNDLCNNLQVTNNNYHYPGLNYLNTNLLEVFPEYTDFYNLCKKTYEEFQND